MNPGQSQHICSHCGLAFRWKPETCPGDDGVELTFCCHGCYNVFQLICGAGLGAFYNRQDRNLPTVTDDAAVMYSDAEIERFIVPEGPLSRIDILVGGISCPSCIWLLERMVARVSGVSDVSVSYAAGIASVRYNPGVTVPSRIFTAIRQLGFVPRPYSPSLSTQEAARERSDLMMRFGTALFLTMQLMAYSYGLYAGYFQGMGETVRSVLQYASLAVATPVVFYSGWPYLAGAWTSFAARRPGMDALIAVGALTAWLYSTWALFSGHETYFESAAMIVTFVLVGRLLELSVRRSAMSGIEALYAAVSQRATLLEEGAVPREVSVDDIRPGDLILVRQGERFPVDSIVVSGTTEADQSLVTGESVPVLVTEGTEVRGGCVNVLAPVTAQAVRPVGQSYVMRVAALVRMAQAGKPSLQCLADRVAGIFVPAVLLLAFIVMAAQYFVAGHDAGKAVMASLAVVLIACPCAMGLAVPAAVLAACSRAASLGILFRGGDVIEKLASVRTALFDKTGTVTIGRPQVEACRSADGTALEEVLQAAATLESLSAHPLARAIVAYAARHGITAGVCSGFTVVPGKGVHGILQNGIRAVCGSPGYFREMGIPLDTLESCVADSDNTVVLVSLGGSAAGAFFLDDCFRPGGHELVARLGRRGFVLCMVSGDSRQVVDRIGADIGFSQVHGELTPEMKLAMVQNIQAGGTAVLMTGDGVNDAPALAQADVSCTLSDSSDIALENADIIITGDDISLLATASVIAEKTMRIIRQNLVWAFAYNMIGIPLAITGRLTPVYAAVAMTASSLIVSCNSLRLMRVRHHG